MWQKTTVAMVLASCSMMAAAAAPSSGKKMQCWTDEKGVRACGDRVPPQYAKTEREVRNAQGVVIDTKSRQKTESEVAEEQRKLDAVAAEKKRLVEQSAYDQYMLQTYDSVHQMEGVRDTRISTLDGRLKLAERAVADTEKSLVDLKARAVNLEKAGKPVNLKLSQQIKQFESSLVDGLKSVATLKKERGETATKFEGDIARYKKLRAGELQIGAPAS